MKMRKTIVSLIAASVLFTACGGGGTDSEGGDDVIDGADKITSKPIIKLETTNFSVIANQSRSIAIPLDAGIVNTDDGTSFYEFKVLSTSGGTASLDRGNFGFLKYTNDGSASGEVQIAVTRDGFESDPVTLTFNVVASTTAQPVTVMMTGQLVGDAGEPRVFDKSVASTENNVVDALGLTWLDNNQMGASADLATHTVASNVCTGEGFRLPTEDELYNIINYGKDYKTNLVDDIFSTELLSSWAEKIDNQRVMVANTTGMRNDIVDSAQYRCVKGTSQNADHLMLSDRVIGDTYDLSTHLQWTPVESGSAGQKTAADAATYCSAKDGVYGRLQTGWRLPTINELRSIVEKGATASVIRGSVAPVIHGGSYTLLSSTSASDDGANYNYGLDLNWFKNEKPVITLFLQEATTINGTSYEPQTSGITCVRTFVDGDVPQ